MPNNDRQAQPGSPEAAGNWWENQPIPGSWKAGGHVISNALAGEDIDPMFVLSGGLERTPEMPGSPGYANVANQQLWANRPNQQNAFGSNIQWTQGPDGRWTQQQSFGGPMGNLAFSLQGQAANAMSRPFDLSALPSMQSGEGARNQAIESAYSQASSRLDPQWNQRQNALHSQLINQGLDPNSEAYKNSMGDFGRDRNDAYTSAMNSAVMQGTAAGDSVFRNSLAGRQQGLSEMLRQRQQPMQDMLMMQGLGQQPDFNQSNDALTAAIAQGNFDMGGYQSKMSAQADRMGGIGSLVGSFFSDERVKLDVRRLEEEALPGVPYATWRYIPEIDPSGALYIGVIAQDLEKVAPQYVSETPEGIKLVDYSFLEVRS
jgi:hypothetical protein